MNNNTQVQLSTTKVLILSILREDYWIFSSGILKLLSQSIAKDTTIDNGSETADSDTSSLSDWSASSKHLKQQQQQASHGNTENSISDLNALDINDSFYDNESNEVDGSIASNDVDDDEDGFYHVGFTPNECTIIFSEKFLEFFKEAIKLSTLLGKDVKLFPDSFYLLEIAGDGLNIGKRVLEITEPLSKGGVSLFFLSNYFSDIVLIPDYAKDKVISLLESKGFQFSNAVKTYNAVGLLSNKDEDDEDIFDKFNIQPTISSSVKLLLTGARATDNRLIVEKFILALSNGGENFPKFFSITKTLQDELALLLPKNFHKFFHFKTRNLVGSLNELMIPINIDLFNAPIDSKGIVSGIAKRLIRKFDDLNNEDCEMSYLSMGRSSIVMIPLENIEIVKSVFVV